MAKYLVHAIKVNRELFCDHVVFKNMNKANDDLPGSINNDNQNSQSVTVNDTFWSKQEFGNLLKPFMFKDEPVSPLLKWYVSRNQ